jgi:hypothetical protein
LLNKGGACGSGFMPTGLLIPCLLVFLGPLGCRSASDDPSATPARTSDKADGSPPVPVRTVNQPDVPSPTSVRILYKGKRSTLKFCLVGSTGRIYDLPGIPGEKETQGGIGLEWTFGGGGPR